MSWLSTLRLSNLTRPSLCRLTSGSAEAMSDVSTPKRRKKKKTNREAMFPFESDNRPTAFLDFETADAMSRGRLKCRKRNLKVIDPPAVITDNLNFMLRGGHREVKEQFSQYLAAAVKFRHHLDARRLPMEERVVKKSRKILEELVRRQYESRMHQAIEEKSLYSELDVETKIQREVDQTLKNRIDRLRWKPIDYDETAAWTYLLGKAAYDYAALLTVLKEIEARTGPDNFQPRSLLDFGSGVGTASWAVSEVFGRMNEVLSIDESVHMNEMNKALLLKGKTQDPLPAGRYMRLHFPRSHELTYDLVVSSHSLLELPSEMHRYNVLDSLWRKTDGFLVVIENGTNIGFQVVQEARHYLKELSKAAKEGDEVELKGHIFSPCPHEGDCPRYEFDNIPCNFDVRYRNFRLDCYPSQLVDDVIPGRFSYVVFRKGERSSDCEWPRIVEEPLHRSAHTICRICTSRATLEEVLTKKKVNNTVEARRLWKYSNSVQCGEQFKVLLESGAEDYDEYRERRSKRLVDPSPDE